MLMIYHIRRGFYSQGRDSFPAFLAHRARDEISQSNSSSMSNPQKNGIPGITKDLIARNLAKKSPSNGMAAAIVAPLLTLWL
jgi:hypothetical protein